MTRVDLVTTILALVPTPTVIKLNALNHETIIRVGTACKKILL